MELMTRQEPLLVTRDTMFKKLFGEVSQAEFMEHFLRSVLEIPEKEMIEITFENTYLNPDYPDKRAGIVDVRISLNTGEIVHVEIQVAKEDSFSERMIFYNSKILVSQLKRKAKYSELKKVVSIYIMAYEHFEDNVEGFHDKFFMKSPKSGRILSNIVEIHTLELGKVPKGKSDDSIVNFLNFINAKDWEEFEVVAETDPVIKKAVARVVELSADEKIRRLVESEEMAEHDLASRFEYHEKKGVERGIEQVAKSMLASGMDSESISKITGLSEADILKIKSI